VFVMILFGNAQLRAESPKQQPTEPDGQAGSKDSGRASERDLGEMILTTITKPDSDQSPLPVTPPAMLN
jgi:hypothetical protein